MRFALPIGACSTEVVAGEYIQRLCEVPQDAQFRNEEICGFPAQQEANLKCFSAKTLLHVRTLGANNLGAERSKRPPAARADPVAIRKLLGVRAKYLQFRIKTKNLICY